MPANNNEQITAGIDSWLETVRVVLQALKRLDGAVDFDNAIGQGWGSLPAEFSDTDGTLLNPPNDSEGVGGVRHTFKPTDLNKAEVALRLMQDFFNGTTITAAEANAADPTDNVIVLPNGQSPRSRLNELIKAPV